MPLRAALERVHRACVGVGYDDIVAPVAVEVLCRGEVDAVPDERCSWIDLHVRIAHKVKLAWPLRAPEQQVHSLVARATDTHGQVDNAVAVEVAMSERGNRIRAGVID